MTARTAIVAAFLGSPFLLSLSDVAALVGRSPGATYYHLTWLERAGLLVKHYRPSANSARLLAFWSAP